MWNPAPDYGHFHFPALWPTLFHCPGSKGDCYVLFKEGSGFEVGQVNHKQTRHVSVRIKSGCFHCTLWLRGYYCPLVTQSERTTTTTACLVQSARASASRPSVLVCRAVWGHPSWSQTVHTPREKKNNNPTLLLIDCLAQERRLCGSSNPANSSHNSDTFSKVNSLCSAIAPRVPPTPNSFTPTAVLFVSAHWCQSLGVVGLEVFRDSKSYHTVNIRWHAASCPHSGSITAQLEPKNKKPGISWIKLATKSCMPTGSWAYFVFENKLQLKPKHEPLSPHITQPTQFVLRYYLIYTNTNISIIVVEQIK